MRRDRGRCVPQVSPHCAGRAHQVHHKLTEQHGGTSAAGDDPIGNLVCVCAPCHQWIHTGHPDRAKKLGWLIDRRTA